MTTTVEIPRKVKAKEFELLVLEACSNDPCGYVYRNGVTAAVMSDPFGNRKTIAMPSLPDFGGVLELQNGRAISFDCKVCSGASIDLQSFRESTGKRRKQLVHLYRVDASGGIAGLLIHFNARQSVTISEPSETFWFPVSERIEFWQSFECGDVATINRAKCETLGTRVDWSVRPRGRKARPDVLSLFPISRSIR